MSTETKTCETCGEDFEHTLGRPGRAPKHCPACRRPIGAKDPNDAREAVRRSRALGAKRSRARAALEATANHGDVARLACALSVLSDPVDAAGLVGVVGSPAELCRLARLARKRHPDLVAGDVGGLSKRLVAALGVMSIELSRSAGLIHPGQIAHGMGAIARAIEALNNAPPSAQFDSNEMSLEIVGSDGKVISLLRSEEKAKDEEEGAAKGA
jgi:hypothetical protein